MRYLVFLFIYIVIIPSNKAQDSLIQSQIKFYSQKIHKYLDKEKGLSSHYKMDEQGIKIYASASDKAANKTEFFIEWEKLYNYKTQLKKCLWEDEIAIYKQGKFNGVIPCDGFFIEKNNNVYDTIPHKTKPLEGLKIAIDPGHIAGDFETGKIEAKYLDFKKDSLKGLPDSIQIAEGMLTFATASLLKSKLEAEGATVFLTRKKNGYTAFNKTFDNWLKDDYKKTIDSLFKEGKFNLEKKNWYLSSKCNKRDKFKLIFKDLELAKRAEIINNFQPDFTIIIHFNVDETNTGWNKPGSKNFNMAFIGGAFMKHDLSSPEKRLEFLRMIITDDIDESVKLSSCVINSFETILNVKTAEYKDATYLKAGCLSTEANGVFCRNLQLTRYIHGPLVYGETLYQDNFNECKLLNKEIDKTKNKRVQQVADAYYQGILKYVSFNK